MKERMQNSLPYEMIKIDPMLHLRQLDLEDAEDVFAIVDENREYLREWLPWVADTKSAQDTSQFISDMIEKRLTGSEYGYAIIYNGFPVGHISLMHITDSHEPEIGYWIAKNSSGQGITTKAVGALTKFAFRTLNLEKVIIKCDESNLPSNRVAEKNSYAIERTENDTRINNRANVWSKFSNK